MKLNSAQHARSAASRLDDVIDHSALEQAREGLGGRDIEEPLIGLEVQKSTLERCETVVFSTTQLTMADARFEVAAAEEQERSAEEQEHERCADGERAMALVEIGSTFTCSLTSRVLEVSLL